MRIAQFVLASVPRLTWEPVEALSETGRGHHRLASPVREPRKAGEDRRPAVIGLGEEA